MNDRLIQLIEQETAKSGITLSTTLDDLGIDSLEFIQLLQTIETEGIGRVPDSKIAHIETVGDLVKALA